MSPVHVGHSEGQYDLGKSEWCDRADSHWQIVSLGILHSQTDHQYGKEIAE